MKGKLEKAKLNKKYWVANARAFYKSQPFATKVYVAIKTKLPISFIKQNWGEIIK